MQARSQEKHLRDADWDRAPFTKLRKAARNVLGLPLLLAVFAPSLFAQNQPPYVSGDVAMAVARPCDCGRGIQQIENFLRETNDALNAWKMVEQETEQQTMTQDQARARWRQLHSSEIDEGLMGCSMKGVVGRTTGGFWGCHVEVRQDYAACACSSIVASTIAHEQIHCFMNRVPWNWITFNVGRSLVQSEIAAHEQQKEFLEEQLENLRRKCNKVAMGASMAPAKKPDTPDIANAANRLGQYAATLPTTGSNPQVASLPKLNLGKEAR